MTTCETHPVSDLAPSGKLVYKTLEYNGELTQKEIVEESQLSSRTVRQALNELESIGVVEDEVYWADARQRLYRLRSTSSHESK